MNNKKQLLAGPYLVWIIGFILLPLVMIVYYAFTNQSGDLIPLDCAIKKCRKDIYIIIPAIKCDSSKIYRVQVLLPRRKMM